MEQYVITISRQFGSMGRSIARELSEILGIEFLDRDIVEATAKRMGLPVSVISDEEESMKSTFFRRQYPLGMGMSSLKDEIFLTQKNIIRDFAAKGSCIIVGRCADYILEDIPNHLNVYVYAPDEARLKNCVENLQMDPQTAKKMMRDVDAARNRYHKAYIPGWQSVFDHKDLMIDSSRFGIDGTAKIQTLLKTSGADGPQIFDLRRQRVIIPGAGRIAYPIGIFDAKARVIIIIEQDIVAGGGEIPRPHAAYDKFALIQGCFHAVFNQGKFLAGQAEGRKPFGPQGPAGAIFRIITVLFTVGGNLSRGAVQIVGEIDIDHGQTGGTTAGETDDAITVGLVAPALVPLQEQRHLSNENIGSKIDGPSQIILSVGVVCHEIRGFGIILGKLGQCFRDVYGLCGGRETSGSVRFIFFPQCSKIILDNRQIIPGSQLIIQMIDGRKNLMAVILPERDCGQEQHDGK